MKYSGNFAFGKNWQGFLKKHFSEQRLNDARKQLVELLGLPDLKGLVFLDIGCGSGIHSLAAWQSGAALVFSFDYDRQSVAAAQALRAKAGAPANWRVCQGSVLDKEFMETLPRADVVYSWGVLHHTGAVWQALENALIPLTGHGLLAIALYSETRYRQGALAGHPSPEEWLAIKKSYNKSAWLGKRVMEARHLYRSYWAPFMPDLWAGWRNLRRKRALYEQNQRGMEFWTDMRDWLGGYPMEFVADRDCYVFMRNQGLEPLKAITGQGNTEYLFRPIKAHNSWNTRLAQRRMKELLPPFKPEKGFMYSCAAPLSGQLDFVWENDMPLGYANASLDAIELLGVGRHLLDDNRLYFSTPDNSDPNTNNRTYRLSYYI